MSKQPLYTIEPPKFSWDKPIEEVILDKVRYMIRSWKHMQAFNIHKNVRDDARGIIMAYQTIEKDIIREIELRAKIKGSDLWLDDQEDTTKATNGAQSHDPQ